MHVEYTYSRTLSHGTDKILYCDWLHSVLRLYDASQVRVLFRPRSKMSPGYAGMSFYPCLRSTNDKDGVTSA